MKAIKARYYGGAVVVKVFVKEPHMDLRPTSKRILGKNGSINVNRSYIAETIGHCSYNIK